MATRPVKLVTDSSSDIPADLAKALDISLVPLAINIGEHTYAETSLTRDAFWELAHAGPHPQTSQPSVGAFDTAYRGPIEQGCDVVCLTVTSKHSGTFGSAWTAAQNYIGRIQVIDSAMISMAHGLQVLCAARLAAEGHALDTILQAIASLRERTQLLIQLDTTEHLRRGGRASRLMPMIDRVSRALHIKPILNMVDGELGLWSIVRSQQKGLVRMLDQVAALPSLEQLYVMHICRPALAETFADMLCRATGFDRDKVHVGEAGAVLACHGGEGVVAVACVTAQASTHSL